MNQTHKYLFGFTAASLRLNETVNIERIFREGGYEEYNDIENREEIIGKGNNRTSIREFRELISRLQKLTPEQKNVLINGDLSAQKQIAFLGVCKHYSFILDFTMEVIREKMLVYDYQLTESDFLSFERKKLETQPEMERLAESTLRKAKQVMIKILEQAGITDSVKSLRIQPQLLSRQVTEAILDDNAEWLKIYLYSDAEVLKMKKTYGKH